ncbi:MAG: ABC-F family ATP-binding cassette domain-containing protein [Clostridiaceae bacterium]|nr:ABC-F family ATP-binding cassette domain-containing protein [Clostridiaceae bacterium]
MAYIQVVRLTKSFGGHELFHDLSFYIGEGERVGLVGKNGCGKTTLLRMMAGLDQPDSGTIRLARRMSVRLLSQTPDPAADMAAACQEGLFPDRSDPLGRLGSGIDLSGQPEHLSGGEQTRLALGCFLAEQPDLMLLDEPTNNLDFSGIQTVIEQLAARSGSMVIVSHDRYLLDRLVTRILELDGGRVTEYAGNYTFYRQEKERLYQEQRHRYEDERKQQRQIEEAIRQTRQWAEKAHRNSTKPDSSGLTMGVKEKKRAKAKKMDKKVKNDVKRLERLITGGERKPSADPKYTFALSTEGRHGKRILEAVDLTMGYHDAPLFLPSRFHIFRQEKVALFGPNGCGKTTLIRMIQGLEKPTGGDLRLSSGCRPHVLAQNLEILPGDRTLLDYLTDKLNGLSGADRAQLAQMGLTLRHLNQPANSFSPGEQMKIKLSELILSSQDFIILDEPTNYLDLHAREQLEQALADYPGTMMIVSHDIYLLRRLCDKVLVFDNRRIRRLETSFSEYMDSQQAGFSDKLKST